MKPAIVLVLVALAATVHAQSLPQLGIIDTGAGYYVVQPACDGSPVAVYQDTGEPGVQRDCCEDQDECHPDQRIL